MQQNRWRFPVSFTVGLVLLLVLGFAPGRVWATGIDGVCGADNGQSFVAAPTAHLCTTGTPTAVIGLNGAWLWNCGGSGGGGYAPCSAKGVSRRGDIVTVAGGGAGDQGTATEAIILNPTGVAFDARGNLYIADRGNQRVRKVNASDGKITTVAGNGTYGYSGDAGAAMAASLSSPSGVSVDAVGNLYIADSNNGRIRKVNASDGNISTVAGTGTQDFSGDGGLATAANLNHPSGVSVDGSGNLFIADSQNHRIRKINALDGKIATVAGTGTYGYSGDGGLATAANLYYPAGVSIDAAGNLYIADQGNHRIRKVNASDGKITTVAGSGTSGYSGDGGAATAANLSSPQSVLADGAGNLYIADYYNNRIRKVNGSDGKISTVAGNGSQGFYGDGGAAISASLFMPCGVAFDAAGNLFVADMSNSRIRKINLSDGNISTVAGNGSQGFFGDGWAATSASIYRPTGVKSDAAGNLYIADSYNGRIRKVKVFDGIISTVAGTGTFGFSGDGGAATAANLYVPSGVSFDAVGNLYIADKNNLRIRKVNASDGIITTVAGSGTAYPLGDGGVATVAGLRYPAGVSVDGAGNLFVADTENNRIRKVNASDGKISTVAGTGFTGPLGDGGAATTASLYNPSGVAPDAAGNLYIADSDNRRIRKVNVSDEKISTVAGTGTYGGVGDGGVATAAYLVYPTGVAFDAAGNLYIADRDGRRIRMVNVSDGKITTVAGTGTDGFSGDGGSATAANLSGPTDVTFDGVGNLYIADQYNNRIRMVLAFNQTATALISSQNPSLYGQGVTFTATVGSGAETPTGSVTFKDGEVILGTGALTNGTATFTTSTLTVGPHSITAVYGGDVNSTGSTSVVLAQSISIDGACGTDNGQSFFTAPTANLCIAGTPTNVVKSDSSWLWNCSGSGGGVYAPCTAKVKPHRGDIVTVAGGGVGDGGAATNASLYYPTGVAFDSAGNLYFADQNNNRIRKVNASDGKISTVAGTGTAGFSGDGGVATAANINNPIGVTIDATGNLFIVDSINNRIRKISASDGKISTIAGSTSGYSGDGGAATAAYLSFPYHVTFDATGSLYIADASNNCIRKVNASDGKISTVAGSGTSGFSGDGGAATAAKLSFPTDVAYDSSGNLYIADRNNQRIRKVNASDGKISTVAGTGTGGFSGDGGSATAANLYTPTGVALDAAGNLYIADTNNNRIRKVNASDGKIASVVGTGTGGFSGDGGAATIASINSPAGVSFDGAGNLYVADTNNSRIRKVNASDGKISTIAGNGTPYFSGDGGAATAAHLSYPNGVTFDGSGNLYVADHSNHRIRKINETDEKISTVAGNGTSGYSGDGGPAISASLYWPSGVLVDGTENLYIADTNNNRIRKVNASDGKISTVAGTGTLGFSGDGGVATAANIASPNGIAFDSIGNLYIADTNNNRIRKVNASDGKISTIAGNGSIYFSGDGGAATAANLYYPNSVSFDVAGNLYIDDRVNNRIRKVNASDGKISTVAGTGAAGFSGDNEEATAAQIYYPDGVSFDGAGNLYIADTSNNRIRKINASDGKISTVAGNGTAGFSGDGGTATAASLNYPVGIAFDYLGNLLIADSSNNRIRKVQGFYQSTTAINSTLNPSGYGQSVTFTATVTSPDGTPTGSVTFKEGATTLGSGTLTNGTATLAISNLPVGSHTITAVYGGDSDFSGSTSTGLTQTVNRINTTTTVSSNYTPSIYGQMVTLTATVTPAAASGNVTFSSGATTYCTAALVSGKATCRLAGLSVGGHTITAAYAGNANYLASQGNVNQTVTANPAPTVVGSAKFTDNGNGTITDNKTGLIWQVPVPNLNWEAALTLCTSSALLGQTDWHLPDINELSSLTFTTATGAIGIDANLFPGGNGLGWSATSDVTDPLQAWIIGQELTPTLLNKLSQQAATCVRTPPTTGQ